MYYLHWEQENSNFWLKRWLLTEFREGLWRRIQQSRFFFFFFVGIQKLDGRKNGEKRTKWFLEYPGTQMMSLRCFAKFGWIRSINIPEVKIHSFGEDIFMSMNVFSQPQNKGNKPEQRIQNNDLVPELPRLKWLFKLCCISCKLWISCKL